MDRVYVCDFYTENGKRHPGPCFKGSCVWMLNRLKEFGAAMSPPPCVHGECYRFNCEYCMGYKTSGSRKVRFSEDTESPKIATQCGSCQHRNVTPFNRPMRRCLQCNRLTCDHCTNHNGDRVCTKCKFY
jgi:hypothetical protein